MPKAFKLKKIVFKGRTQFQGSVLELRNRLISQKKSEIHEENRKNVVKMLLLYVKKSRETTATRTKCGISIVTEIGNVSNQRVDK